MQASCGSAKLSSKLTVGEPWQNSRTKAGAAYATLRPGVTDRGDPRKAYQVNYSRDGAELPGKILTPDQQRLDI